MSTLDLLNAIGAAQDEYIIDACFAKSKRRSAKIHYCLIAALIAVFFLLAGCAVLFLRLENLILIDHQAETVAAISEPQSNTTTTDYPTEPATASVESEKDPGPFVSKQVLSMQGYEGSPAYNALQEWLAYETDYIIQNPNCRFQDTFRRPDSYQIYACYTQEMVDKLDEICSKYRLHLMGKSIFLNSESKMEEHNLTYVLSPNVVTRCFYGNLFEDGSFIAEGELVLSGDYDRVVQFQMHRILKDAFYPVSLPIDMGSYTQWNYNTKDGSRALMALKSNTGLVITENKDYFITIIIEEVPDANMVWHGLPAEKAFLEAVCNSFVYSEP